MIDFKLIHFLLTLQLFIKISATVNERQIGLSSLAGGALNPDNLLGAIKLASGLSKVAGVPNAVMGTTFKALEDYSPITVPQTGEEKVEPTISLDDKQLKIYLPQERVNQLVKSVGLDSQNIDWKLFRCPLSMYQLKTIVANKKSSSPGLSIMPMESYIPKIMSNIDRLSDSYFRRLEKCIDSEMDLDDFMELVEQLDEVEEGLIVLPVSIKSGALQNRPGSIVLLCLGKFPPDKKQSEPSTIMPTILIGTVNHALPIQPKPEPVTSAPTPTSNTMNDSLSEPVVEGPSIIEVDESPVAEAGVPVIDSNSESFDIPDLDQLDTIISSQSSSSSSSSSSAQIQAKVQPQPQLQPQPQPQLQPQPQPQLQPQPFPRPQMAAHAPPPPQGRPSRPPPQSPPNFQARPPSFDGRPPFPHQPGRPIPRPRTEMHG